MQKSRFLALLVILLVPLAAPAWADDDDSDGEVRDVVFFHTATAAFGTCPLGAPPVCPSPAIIGRGTMQGDLKGEITLCVGNEGNATNYPRLFGCFELRTGKDTFQGNFSGLRVLPFPTLARAFSEFAGDNGPNLAAPDGTKTIRGRFTEMEPGTFFDQATIVSQEDDDEDSDEDSDD